MADVENQVDERAFPPGTVRLSDKADTHLILAPQPTSDPNDPLVRPYEDFNALELFADNAHQNWSIWRKTLQMTLLSFYAIFVFACITVSPTLWSEINLELGFSYTTLNDSYGVSAATLSIGCLIFTPFALRFGRRPIYLITSLLLLAADIWSASMQTVPDIMLTNVILGAAGSVNEALFQMTVCIRLKLLGTSLIRSGQRFVLRAPTRYNERCPVTVWRRWKLLWSCVGRLRRRRAKLALGLLVPGNISRSRQYGYVRLP